MEGERTLSEAAAAAITGSITSRDETPYIPVTADQIVDAAVESWRAGASVVHLHARDRDGIPTQDPAIYATVVERIRATGCTAILNLSTGSAGGRAELDDRLDCLELRPEVATLDCGSMNYSDDRVFANPFSFLRRAAERGRELDVVAEIQASLNVSCALHKRSVARSRHQSKPGKSWAYESRARTKLARRLRGAAAHPCRPRRAASTRSIDLTWGGAWNLATISSVPLSYTATRSEIEPDIQFPPL